MELDVEVFVVNDLVGGLVLVVVVETFTQVWGPGDHFELCLVCGRDTSENTKSANQTETCVDKHVSFYIEMCSLCYRMCSF